ncbi:hypothetical protein [Virgibacillus doumboii]|uniref:hypothetical protein n=1 Tax=Virgibacillus doumboii TaxID=2697503 RepID=UPI0013DF30EB|nr:hypothetical protein [Virgibacillus doumboii]
MISQSFVETNSVWGVSIKNQFLKHEASSDCLAVFFPGKEYSCQGPLLHYTRKACLLSGCDTLSLTYGFQAANTSLTSDQIDDLVEDTLETIDSIAAEYEKIIFVSKSLGTLVAGIVSEKLNRKHIHHFFMTPIPKTIKYIENSTGYVVVGDRDDLFSEENIEKINNIKGIKSLIIPGAKHSLELDDDYKKSLEILSLITDTCSDLVREVKKLDM